MHVTNPAPHTSRRRRRSRRPRLLVVEDDSDLWTALERVARLVDPAMQVDCASDTAHAVERMSQARYDLILVDFLLADSPTGYSLRSVCRRLQPGATFALMSALPLRTQETDGCPFLLKPFSVSGCRDFIGGLLESS